MGVNVAVEEVDFAKEAEKMASTPKEEYIKDDFADKDSGPQDQQRTYEEAESEFQDNQERQSSESIYRSGAKLAITTENSLIPRFLAKLSQDEVGKYKLTQTEQDDLIDALTVCFEHSDIRADDPWLAFLLLYGSFRGIQVYDVYQDRRRRLSFSQPPRPPAPKPVPSDKQEWTKPPESEDLEQPDQKKKTRTCLNPTCDNELEEHQRKYCGRSCTAKHYGQMRKEKNQQK